MQKSRTPNFIYPELKPEHRQFGASVFTRPIVNPTGDWRKDLPPEEEQRRNGVEPSTCYLYSQTHSDATFEEFVFAELDNDYAERFPAQFSKGTPQGGDPLKGADSIYDHGSIKESSMPFNDTIHSWADYHSWKGVDKDSVIAEGRADKMKKGRYGIMIFEKNTPLDTKYLLMEEASKRGVVCISIWGIQDGDTYVEKPAGVSDTHMVEVSFPDRKNKVLYIRDTYPPFDKKLPVNYNPDFGLVRYVEKKTQAPNVYWETLKSVITGLIEIVQGMLQIKQAELKVELTKPTKTLREVVLESVGKDMSPQNLAPQELSCAEGVSNILHSVYPEFPAGILSTTVLFQELKKSPRFKGTLDFNKASVIVSPRTSTMPGHTGFCIDGKIISNDSLTGTVESNYTFASWIKYFRDEKQLHTYLFLLSTDAVA